MKTFEDKSIELIRTKHRLQAGFRPKWDKKRKEFTPVYFYVKHSWKLLRVRLEPVYHHPKTLEPMLLAWTEFWIEEGWRSDSGEVHWYAIGYADKYRKNVVDVPFINLITGEHKAFEMLRLMDGIVLFLDTFLEEDETINLMPVRDYYYKLKMEYTVEFIEPDSSVKDATPEEAKLRSMFNADEFKNWIHDNIEMHKLQLHNFVYHQWKMIPKEVQVAAKKAKEPVLHVPLVIKMNEWIEDFVQHSLPDFLNNPDEDAESFAESWYDSFEADYFPFNINDINFQEIKLI